MSENFPLYLRKYKVVAKFCPLYETDVYDTQLTGKKKKRKLKVKKERKTNKKKKRRKSYKETELNG